MVAALLGRAGYSNHISCWHVQLCAAAVASVAGHVSTHLHSAVHGFSLCSCLCSISRGSYGFLLCSLQGSLQECMHERSPGVSTAGSAHQALQSSPSSCRHDAEMCSMPIMAIATLANCCEPNASTPSTANVLPSSAYLVCLQLSTHCC